MNIHPVAYHSQEDKSSTQALHYSKTHDSTHRYLAYRDIPLILKQHLQGKKALDYGTGTGYSAQFLHELGFDVTGVDISKEMLRQAQLKYPNLSFCQIENGNIPCETGIYDLIFSSFVLFEMGTQDAIVDYLIEAKRVMQKDGLFIAVTGSQDLHCISKKWLNFHTDFPQNKDPISGSLVKLHLYGSGMEFTDYYWTEANYRSFFTEAGFELIDVCYPLGDIKEEHLWKDELLVSPFVILVAKIS